MPQPINTIGISRKFIMTNKKITTGIPFLDQMLGGGYESDTMTVLYGPAGSGKTCMCILAALAQVQQQKKVFYIDTEGGFSTERLSQITPDAKVILSEMIFFTPVSFTQQREVFEKMRSLPMEKLGLIIVDTIGMLYRLELGQTDDIYGVNRELGRQISYLSEIARTRNVPILLTNQVYANFEERTEVKMVGGDILRYGSKCLIELKCYKNGVRKALLRKHRSIAEGGEVAYRMVQSGVEKIEE